MGETFDALQRLENQLDDWIYAATPATSDARGALTPAQKAGIDQLRALRVTLESTILRVLAVEAQIPAAALAQPRQQLAALSANMTALEKSLTTLASVLSVAGTAVSVAATVVAAALPLV